METEPRRSVFKLSKKELGYVAAGAAIADIVASTFAPQYVGLARMLAQLLFGGS